MNLQQAPNPTDADTESDLQTGVLEFLEARRMVMSHIGNGKRSEEDEA